MAGMGLGFFATTLAARGIASVSNITITRPASGSVQGTIQIEVSATGTICSIWFTVDGQPIGVTLVNPPWTATWSSTTVSNGSHQLGVVAVDADGVLTTASVTISVNNLSTSPPPPGSSPPRVAPSPPASSCSLPDPYAATGGGLCVGGQWVAPSGRLPFVPLNIPSLSVVANVPQSLIASPPVGHVELGTVTVAIVGLPRSAALRLVAGNGPTCSLSPTELIPASPVSAIVPLSYGSRRLDDGAGVCVTADRSVTLKVTGTYRVAR
jgi:hypothetical protein